MELALLIANHLWSNIKSYQSETTSQHSPSQNSLSYCTQVACLQKDAFRFSLHSHRMFWLY